MLLLIWVCYCCLHSALAAAVVKKWVGKRTGTFYRFYRLGYTVFAATSLAAIVLWQIRINSPLAFEKTLITSLAGSVVGLLGLLVMIICIRKYFMSLSGVKSLFETQPATPLMITGIHRHVRHPLYAGTFLALWSAWLIIPLWSLFISNAVITAYTLIAIRWEEQKLVQQFGEAYSRYQARVPKLFPRF